MDMQNTINPSMEPSRLFCPNVACSARGQIGMGNIIIHDRKRNRYRCTRCHKTFSGRKGTMFEGLRKPSELVVIVVTLISYGCPLQAIVHAFGLDERTVASWRDRAGTHCRLVHRDIIETAQLDLQHVQADEIRIKGCKLVAWMGLAMMVSTRLWLAGTVSLTRDRALADRLLQQVRRCGQALKALLVCTDGWSAYVGSIQRAFREKVKETKGRGRARLCIWPELHIGTVIKRTQKKRVVEVTRTISYGSQEQAERLLELSGGGNVLNTAFIERLNATMRQRLATLTRKCRQSARRLHPLETGMYLLGTTYNLCWAHHELSKPTHEGRACTPAMAAGLTDHIWSVSELLHYKIAPAPWVESKRRGRPMKLACPPAPAAEQSRFRALVRLRKGVLCSATG
jgi:transposase-like protein/IS1 family transposase